MNLQLSLQYKNRSCDPRGRSATLEVGNATLGVRHQTLEIGHTALGVRHTVTFHLVNQML